MKSDIEAKLIELSYIIKGIDYDIYGNFTAFLELKENREMVLSIERRILIGDKELIYWE